MVFEWLRNETTNRHISINHILTMSASGQLGSFDIWKGYQIEILVLVRTAVFLTWSCQYWQNEWMICRGALAKKTTMLKAHVSIKVEGFPGRLSSSISRGGHLEIIMREPLREDLFWDRIGYVDLCVNHFGGKTSNFGNRLTKQTMTPILGFECYGDICKQSTSE